MDVKEWALITFSILAQMSVGTFILLGFAHWYASKKTNSEIADQLSTIALLAIWPTLGLGILASLFHLGNPLNAPRAISNLGASWLSREILMGILFGLSGVVFAFMQWKRIGSQSARNYLAVLAALIGVGLVYSMANVYMLEAQPAWNTLATPVQFFVTTFLLGALALGVALMASYTVRAKSHPGCQADLCTLMKDLVKRIAVVSVVMLGVELVTIPLRLAYLAGSGVPEAVASAGMYFNPYSALSILRLVLVFLGAGVFGLFIYRTTQMEKGEEKLGTIIYSAFTMVLAAEVIGRFLFYATHIGIGL